MTRGDQIVIDLQFTNDIKGGSLSFGRLNDKNNIDQLSAYHCGVEGPVALTVQMTHTDNAVTLISYKDILQELIQNQKAAKRRLKIIQQVAKPDDDESVRHILKKKRDDAQRNLLKIQHAISSYQKSAETRVRRSSQSKNAQSKVQEPNKRETSARQSHQNKEKTVKQISDKPARTSLTRRNKSQLSVDDDLTMHFGNLSLRNRGSENNLLD